MKLLKKKRKRLCGRVAHLIKETGQVLKKPKEETSEADLNVLLE